MSTMAAYQSGPEENGCGSLVPQWCANSRLRWRHGRGARSFPPAIEQHADYSRKLFWTRFTEAIEDIPELAGATLHGLRCTAAIHLRGGTFSP